MNPKDSPFRNWAVVAHKDDTGFGRQAADLRSVLGFGWHFVIPSERLSDHPLTSPNEIRLAPGAPVETVRELLDLVEGIVFFERHSWHPQLLSCARKMGVATACVVNWEWFNGKEAQWRDCDLFVCPSRFSETIVRRYGWSNVVTIPWALDLAKLPARQISGPARLFVHNAGIVDSQDRKGTRDAIKAFRKFRHSDIRLRLRLQKEAKLPAVDDRVEILIGNTPSVRELYDFGDCAIQPSKMEGIGFMVLEAVCSGMPVITVDYPPMNEFVLQPELRCRTRWFRRKAFPTPWIPHAHLKLPHKRDLARRIQWAAEHDLSAVSRQNREWAVRTFDPAALYKCWTEALLPITTRPEAALRCG